MRCEGSECDRPQRDVDNDISGLHVPINEVPLRGRKVLAWVSRRLQTNIEYETLGRSRTRG
jgi:hypothetical protein